MAIKIRKGRVAAAVVALGATFGLASSTALANGPCGANNDAAHACGVNAATVPYVAPGTISDPSVADYYVFYGTAGTQMSAVVSGYGSTALDFMGGSFFADPMAPGVGTSSANSVEADASYTLPVTGTYYFRVIRVDLWKTYPIVPLPYTLTIKATPAVQWPPPPPPPPPPPIVTPPVVERPAPPLTSGCLVPRPGGPLSAVRHRLKANHCRLAPVYYQRSRYPRGRILGFETDPLTRWRKICRPGTYVTGGSRLGVLVSSGRH